MNIPYYPLHKSWRGQYGIFMERIIWYIHGEDNMVYSWRG
jgi:hypothetical protein